MVSKLTRFFAFIAIFSLPTTCFPMFNGSGPNLSDLLWKNLALEISALGLAKGAGILYATQLSSILIHELGHALPSKIFFYDPINIHIGDDKTPSIFSHGGITLHKNLINPLTMVLGINGLCVHSDYTNIKGIQAALVHGCGPLAEMAYLCALTYLASKNSHLNFLPPLFFPLIANAINNLKIAEGPTGLPLDGYHLVNALSIKKKYETFWNTTVSAGSLALQGAGVIIMLQELRKN